MRLVPTSMTVAPGFTSAPLISRGRPAATTSRSAVRVRSPSPVVREWACTTVASDPRAPNINAIGRPTRNERPTTTAIIPAVGMP